MKLSELMNLIYVLNDIFIKDGKNPEIDIVGEIKLMSSGQFFKLKKDNQKLAKELENLGAYVQNADLIIKGNLKQKILCQECGSETELDNCVCQECYDDIKKERDSYEEDLAEAENKIGKLENEIEELENKIRELKNY